MRRSHRICMLLAAAAALAGCEEPQGPAGPTAIDGIPILPGRDPDAGRKDRDYLLAVRIRLMTVQVPVGSVSESKELWSCLDDEPVGAHAGSALAHNGFRVGLAPKGAWKGVADILQRLTGQPLAIATILAPPGSFMPIVFKRRQKTQTIFTFRRDCSLVGRDYPPGDNVAMTTVNIDYDDPSFVYLTAALAVRPTRRRPRYAKRDGKYALTSETVYHRLADLGFRFKVPRGGFIVIGPSRKARRKSSPGYHFLIHQRKGQEFETVVIIAPEVFLTPLKQTGAEAGR